MVSFVVDELSLFEQAIKIAVEKRRARATAMYVFFIVIIFYPIS
jgi:hypothetical protein